MPTQAYSDKFMALVRRARTDFLAYYLLFNNPETSGKVCGDLQQYLIKLVQDVADDEIGARQSISVPPQHTKSTTVTVEGMSWVMGRFPGTHVGITGHSDSLVRKFSKEIRSRVDHPWYHELVFPDSKIKFGSNLVNDWEMSNGSGLRANSIGAKFTGHRIDWLIMDDVHKGRAEAESETQRESVIQWYSGDCKTRLSPEGKVLVIGTRWHPEDLIGHLTSEEYEGEIIALNQEQELFEVTNLPAICEHSSVDPLGRETGDALFPEVRNIDFLNAQRATLPSYEWESQFQGNPTAAGSGEADLGKLVRIEKEEVPTDIEWHRGWDLALGEKKHNDHSAGALCAYDKRTQFFYIIDMFHHKLVWTKLRPRLEATAIKDKKLYDSHRMSLEAVSGFDIGLRELRTGKLKGEVKIIKRNPTKGGKLLRAQDWLTALEGDRVHIVSAPWNKKFIEELRTFPEGKHDDQVDAVSIAWESLVRPKKLLFA